MSPSLRAHLVPEAAEAELRAQIERAIAAGIAPTHIDAHMAAAMLPELLDLHVRLGLEYGVVPVLPRGIRWAPERESYAAALAWLDAMGLPVIDHFRGTLPVQADQTRPHYREVVAGLPAGVTHFALHATVPGEIETIAPDHAGWRTREFALFASGAVAEWCAAAGIAAMAIATSSGSGVRELRKTRQDRRHLAAESSAAVSIAGSSAAAILLNLLSNAAKFSDPDKPIEVRYDTSSDGEIMISVIDQGIGMAPEQISEATRPFYQADSRLSRKYEGTGLGLSIVSGLVECHGGRLIIESQPDIGSRISVAFPPEVVCLEATEITEAA